jgi:hypothetical protein
MPLESLSLVKIPSDACAPSQNLSTPRVGEDPLNSGIEAASTVSASNDASQLQDYISEDDFLASVSTLW